MDVSEFEKERDKRIDEILKYGFDKTAEDKKLVDEMPNKLIECYHEIITILKYYCDLEEDNYNIIALWIIGTYIHKQFFTFPYLFFNAMKGSGKTRLLKLIKALAWNGELLASMSEAVLFRTAGTHSICIDEFEHIGSKENSALRELLNAAYKKGIQVKRAKKDSKGEWKIEEFNVFSPICMANIWGNEDVLADRCITLILDKSHNKNITRLLECFEIDKSIANVRLTLNLVQLCSYFSENDIEAWNYYIHNNTNNTNNTNYINNTNYNKDINNNINIKMFEKIKETSLDGRHLELLFPLFIIAERCGVLDKTIDMAEVISKRKKGDDLMENKDVSLIDFISEQIQTEDYLSMKELSNQFKEYLETDEEESKWINAKWVGRALKRLNLIKDKRRMGKGMEITLNYKKAKEKIKMFKEHDTSQECLPEPQKAIVEKILLDNTHIPVQSNEKEVEDGI